MISEAPPVTPETEASDADLAAVVAEAERIVMEAAGSGISEIHEGDDGQNSAHIRTPEGKEIVATFQGADLVSVLVTEQPQGDGDAHRIEVMVTDESASVSADGAPVPPEDMPVILEGLRRMLPETDNMRPGSELGSAESIRSSFDNIDAQLDRIAEGLKTAAGGLDALSASLEGVVMEHLFRPIIKLVDALGAINKKLESTTDDRTRERLKEGMQKIIDDFEHTHEVDDDLVKECLATTSESFEP